MTADRHLEAVPDPDEPVHLEIVQPGYLHRDEVTPIEKAAPRHKPRRGLARMSKKRREAELALRKAKTVVRARSGGRCEASAWPHRCTIYATDYHHVKPRSRGGEHSARNLLHLCANAHDDVHANPDAARKAGFTE